jgi:hypothetical protein
MEIKDFHFFTSSRTALGPTEPPMQWLPRAIYPEVKQPRYKADNSPQTSSKNKKNVIQVMGGFIPSTQRYYRRLFLLLKLLHASVVRPSSGRNIFARITRLTTDPSFLEIVNIIEIGFVADCSVDPPITWISYKQQDANTQHYEENVSLCRCFKNSFTTLKAYTNLFKGHVRILNCQNVAKSTEFCPVVMIQCDFQW